MSGIPFPSLPTWLAMLGRGFQVFLLLLALLPVLFLVSRGCATTTRVDRDGGPAPAWLPQDVTDLHLRGTTAVTWFSGHCSRQSVEEWATQHDIPIKARQQKTEMVDYAPVPLGWSSTKELYEASLRTNVEAEALIWERRQSNGGGITLVYIPSLGAFHGSQSLW